MPYTDYTLEDWGAEKVGKIDVICPGFSADCLETLEEIALENRELFIEAGGGDLRYIPALNDSAGQIDALANLVLEVTGNWHAALAEFNDMVSESAARADALEMPANAE